MATNFSELIEKLEEMYAFLPEAIRAAVIASAIKQIAFISAA